MEWLIEAFGFEEDMRMTSDAGRVEHGQLKLGDDIVMLGEPGSHYERAKAAGAEIHMEPTDQPYGDRRYDTEDLEGHNWFFAQRPGD